VTGAVLVVSGRCAGTPPASAQVASCIYIMLLSLCVISGFDWDDDTILLIERHQFTPDEVEEVFAGGYNVRRTRQKLYVALGETLDGRLAFVVFCRLSRGLIRVVTARDMEDSERRLFRRK
jgi:uncharacterized DUF497 family protein